MTHDEIKNNVAEKAGVSKAQAETIIKAYVDEIKNALITDLEARIVGIGTLKVRPRAAREGRNPKTKEEIHIDATLAVALSVSEPLKKEVNAKLDVVEVAARLEK
jgi:DNA-binding protein HU-beta